MIRFSFILVLLAAFALNLYGQEQKSVLRAAEEAYARQEYAVAGALYYRIARSRKEKMPLGQWMRLARCYQEIGDFRKAAACYKDILELPGCSAAVHFAYGEVLRQLEQYEAARQQYTLFSTSNPDSLQLKAVSLQSCDSAESWRRGIKAVELRPLKELNTPGSDLVTGVVQQGLLVISNGYRSLLLNGRTESRPATDMRTEEPYYKAYLYKQYSTSNTNMYLEELAPFLFDRNKYHIGPVCLNKTEDTLYATINLQGKPANGIRHLQLYQSIKKDGRWTPLVLLPGINVAGYTASHAVLGGNGSVLYFISDRPGGIGQTDIWYCEKQADGTWGQPQNCGSKINTVSGEIFPTINEDGMLYFSSKGHAGLGGYDIYRAKGEKNNWEAPENIRAPFNSGADDMGLILKENGYEGYLASNKEGGRGWDDVYYFNTAGYFGPSAFDNKPPVPSPAPSGKGDTAEEQNDKRALEQLKFHVGERAPVSQCEDDAVCTEDVHKQSRRSELTVK
jgi:hypothetical protein